MYSKIINVPIILEVGENIFIHMDEILRRNHIFFKEKILVTSPELKELYKKQLDLLPGTTALT